MKPDLAIQGRYEKPRLGYEMRDTRYVLLSLFVWDIFRAAKLISYTLPGWTPRVWEFVIDERSQGRCTVLSRMVNSQGR